LGFLGTVSLVFAVFFVVVFAPGIHPPHRLSAARCIYRFLRHFVPQKHNLWAKRLKPLGSLRDKKSPGRRSLENFMREARQIARGGSDLFPIKSSAYI
jgi:hypothetical protein